MNPGPTALAIADGFAPEGGTGTVRVTVTLTPGPGTSDEDLSNWPRLGRSLGKSLKLIVREPGIDRRALGSWVTTAPLARAVGAKEDRRPDAIKSIVDLWNRVMAPPCDEPGGPWDSFRKVVLASEPGRDVPERVMLATPASAAAVALTSGRARSLLDHLAAHGAISPFGARDSRPTLSAPLPELASLDAFVPGPVSVRIAKEGPVIASAAHIARAALGHDGGLQSVMAAIHGAHEACTPTPAPVGRFSEEAADATAARRMAAILSSPVLQRLFGWAIDLEADLSQLVQHGLPPEGRFVLLAVDGVEGPLSWTLAKFRPAVPGRSGHFGPASWREKDFGVASTYEGLEVLNALGAAGPRYDLCTVDPELALEAAVGVDRQRAAGRLDDDQHHTLRSGGLRLVDRDVLSSLRAARAAPASSAPQSDVSGSGHGSPSPAGPIATDAGAEAVLDAEALKPRLRLDLGLDTPSGTRWRCAMFRIVRYADPVPGLAHADWMETELNRLLGPPNGRRRLELEAGTVTTTVLSVEDVAEAPDWPIDKTLDSSKNRDVTAIEDFTRADAVARRTKLIAESTLASWGGEPMGSPAQDRVQNVELELDIDRTVSLPSRATGEPAWRSRCRCGSDGRTASG